LLTAQAKVIIFSTTGRVKAFTSQLTEIKWEEPVLIPWSRERMLLLGQRLPQYNVSRGTTPI
jgi:hypothetical protein